MPSGSSSNPGDFFSWFDVSYDENKPYGSIDEIHGQSADINKGFGGEYVWLIPHKASGTRGMVDNFWIDICDSANDGKKDLAKGAGGDYRFFSSSNNMSASQYVTDVALWRCGDKQSDAPNDWDHISDDINKGRGGDFLYFVWRTKQYVGSKP